MKKLAIAGASVALAAMPIVGVSAVPAEINTMTDNITVTVPTSCSITNINTDPNAQVGNLTNTYEVTIANGNYQEFGGNGTTAGGNDSAVGVTCNGSGSDTGWRVTAVGAGAAGYENKLHKSGASDGQKDINSSTHVESGATSNWDFKVTVASPAVVASGFTSNTWTPVPAAGSEMDVATGTGTAAEGTLTMNYSVYVSGTQDGGTYSGAVKYTLYNPAS